MACIYISHIDSLQTCIDGIQHYKNHTGYRPMSVMTSLAARNITEEKLFR